MRGRGLSERVFSARVRCVSENVQREVEVCQCSVRTRCVSESVQCDGEVCQ